MFRTGKWAAAIVIVGASVWAGLALTAQEPKATGAQSADLTALREAVATAAKKGENVDEVRKALAALEKVLPGAKPGAVPPELQALREAVEAAAKKGENVEAVQKELATVETAVAGRSFAPRKPVAPIEPQPAPPNPFNPPRLDPAPPFPFVPPAGIDADAFQKGMDLRMKALEMMAKDPRNPEAQKLQFEANKLMLMAIRPANGAFPGLPDLDHFPDAGRGPDRARLGIKFEKLAAITAEQLGLDADVGIAVAGVLPGSVAERAGLKLHDIVIEFAGKPASSNTDEFLRQVNAAKAGEKLDLVLMRKGKKVEIKGVVLPEVGRPVVAPRAAPVPLPDLVPPRAKPVPLPALPPIPEKSGAVDIRTNADPAKVDLGDLRDAVTTAEKRGENVGAIRDAFTALEKALAKGAVKPGEAPPELSALRGAVESAAKKGENVAPIAKELGAVEKALTGKEYERPKIEEPKPEFPQRPGGFGNPGRIVIANRTSVVITNGNFVIRARTGEVNYTITGTTDPTTAPKISIKDGDKTIEVEDVKKVPEEYRAHVEKLLKSVNR